jgi:hypothetical protein
MINDSQHDILQSNEIIELLETPEAQLFLNKHKNERPENLALTYSGKVNFDLPKLTFVPESTTQITRLGYKSLCI